MNFVSIEEPLEKVNSRKIVLFSYGFRPFFLGAGLYAIISMIPWFSFLFQENSIFKTILTVSEQPTIWHSHEMLFGIVAAAIAGFLLTAVPNWTGCKPQRGAPLVLLFVFWLLGRIGFWTMNELPSLYHIDLLFLPLVIIIKAPPLIKAGKLRNMAFLLILMALFACNSVVHYGLFKNNYELARTGMNIAIYIIIVLIAIIGGRVIPGFTKNTLRRDGISENVRSFPLLDKIIILGVLVVGTSEIIFGLNKFIGLLALIVGTLHFIRLYFWQGWKTFYDPILWILHVGYIWLPIGFLLKGLSSFGLVDYNIATHCFTSGLMALMILAIMTRASLGHTGRELKVSKLTAISYLCVLSAAIFRTAIPALGLLDYMLSIKMAGILWISGFIFFTIIYAPILLFPRADGREG